MNRQRERQEFEVKEMKTGSSVRNLTDGDLDELRGSIELGFGFNEEDGGHNLRGTLPALDLYFAVNRQLSDPKLRSFSTPGSMPASAAETPSPSSPREDQRNSDDWKICNPGMYVLAMNVACVHLYVAVLLQIWHVQCPIVMLHIDTLQ